ncbi:MAG: phosphoribosyltransferase [Verrucomicrobia bacterium]|nr:phosphoribosyltransferase [Verrucomicrobiota bacterium]
MTFADRQTAGQNLGQQLARKHITADLVLGLPRGGVVVAAEVARELGRPLGALVVRKIGHPRHREFAVGAIAGDGTVILHEEVLARTGIEHADLEDIIADEKSVLAEYQRKFHGVTADDLAGKCVMLVDDGLATGSTAEAAVFAAKHLGATRVLVAIPVASDSAMERLKKIADEVFALEVDPLFEAVGQYYRSFRQTADEEVERLLAEFSTA